GGAQRHSNSVSAGDFWRISLRPAIQAWFGAAASKTWRAFPAPHPAGAGNALPAQGNFFDAGREWANREGLPAARPDVLAYSCRSMSISPMISTLTGRIFSAGACAGSPRRRPLRSPALSDKVQPV